MTRVAMNTVLKLLADLGAACSEYQDKKLRGLTVKRFQCDEIWSFCYAKDRNVPERFKDQDGYGSVWTWTAIDADTKLMLTWFIGARDAACANAFMLDVASRIERRTQLTTDDLKAYRWATALAFPDGSIDYAKLVKVYAGASDGSPNAADHIWTLDELIALLPEQPKGRVRKIGAPPASERRLVAGYQAE